MPFPKYKNIAHLALIFLSMGGSRSHTKPCASARRATVYFCLGHIGRPVSTSARNIAKKILTWNVQVWEGPSCIAYLYGSFVAWETQQAHPREQMGVTCWGAQHM